MDLIPAKATVKKEVPASGGAETKMVVVDKKAARGQWQAEFAGCSCATCACPCGWSRRAARHGGVREDGRLDSHELLVKPSCAWPSSTSA